MPRHVEPGGEGARHGQIQQIVDTVSKGMGIAAGIYNAGRTVAPYIRPVLSAVGTAVAAAI